MDAELLQQISQLAKPAERVQRANQLMADYQAAITEISRLRREALEELIALGRTQTDIAAELGMTRARVGQLLSSGPPPERLFFGAGAITVALGGKREADSRGPGRVLAQEDVEAYDHLRELAKGFSLDITYETVEPPGFLNLNRDNLIVICGPRLSPLLAQVLESDCSLGFENDDRGWYLVDRVTQETYRSPMDAGQHRDYAYLGRLPRLDGRGNFLYIAGIHAMGAPCVIHYLENHLTELYSEVKTRRFSTIISGDFDAETLDVSSSSRLTPIYRPESG
ncbi:MAG: sigma-70 family RNA polymerase sigma factor [Pseudonocardiaceae bacterium]